MVLGIDIDDTLTMTTEKAMEILAKNPQYKNIDDYHHLPEEIFNKFIDDNIDEIQKKLEIKKGALEALKLFKDKGIKIIFITMRGYAGFERLIPLTCSYFAKNSIPYDKIIFGQNEKGEVAKKHKVDIFIDDKESVLDEVSNYGIKTIRMARSDIESKHKLVTSWQEIKDIIIKEMEDV